jgi:septum formation protein
MNEAPMNLVLASGSPRRRDILNSIGWSFGIVLPNVDEGAIAGERPKDMALRLAEAKATAASRLTGGAVTVGADTVVDIDGEAFGKPLDRDDQLRMLRILSGRVHLVHTGIALARSGEILASGIETTKVRFGSLTEYEISSFSDSHDGDDKAGGYAIQGRGALLVEGIEGCYYNVVGLPVFLLNKMLVSLGEC